MRVTGKFSYLTSVDAKNSEEAKDKALWNFFYDAKGIEEDPEVWIDFEEPYEVQKSEI